MNLVQINERLKDLPMQVLQQYANGMNPEVPPYLALGELQRRESSQKQAATAQGAAQGPQPSIKEQVEQKAGLMALQQMQQQQMAQQQQQPSGPMPVPAGAPQPEAQPQPEMMARGGLAAIPVRRDMFEYAGGGIIAFQSGGQSLNERAARQMEEKGSIYDPYFGLPAQERERMKQEAALKAAQERASQSMAVTESNAQALAGEAQARVNELESNREALIRQYGPRQYEQALAKAKQAIATASSRGSELMAQQSQMGQSMVAEATPPPRPAAPISRPTTQITPQQMEAKMSSGLPAALQKAGSSAASDGSSPMAGAPMPGAPRPAPAQAGAPVAAQAGLPAALAGAPEFSATPISPRIAQVDEMMASQKRTAPTAQGVISDVNALLPEGMQDEATKRRFAEQRARAEASKAAYEKSQPTGLDNLIRVLGQAGQYKGFSGIGPAYTANQQQRRAEDLAFQRQQDELLTAIEGRERGAEEKLFGARSTAMDRAQQSFSESEKTALAAAVKQAEMEQGRLSDDNKAKMALDVKKFEAAQQEKLKNMDIAQRERERATTAAGSGANNLAEYVSLMARSRAEREKGTPEGIKNANELEAKARSMMEWKGGSSGAAGERNDITAIKAIQASLQKELSENLRMDAATRARKQAELDKTYTDLARLGGAGAPTTQAGKVVDFSSLPK